MFHEAAQADASLCAELRRLMEHSYSTNRNLASRSNSRNRASPERQKAPPSQEPSEKFYKALRVFTHDTLKLKLRKRRSDRSKKPPPKKEIATHRLLFKPERLTNENTPTGDKNTPAPPRFQSQERSAPKPPRLDDSAERELAEFRKEIERRYQKSTMNQTYVFPRKVHYSTDEESPTPRQALFAYANERPPEETPSTDRFQRRAEDLSEDEEGGDFPIALPSQHQTFTKKPLAANASTGPDSAAVRTKTPSAQKSKGRKSRKNRQSRTSGGKSGKSSSQQKKLSKSRSKSRSTSQRKLVKEISYTLESQESPLRTFPAPLREDYNRFSRENGTGGALSSFRDDQQRVLNESNSIKDSLFSKNLSSLL